MLYYIKSKSLKESKIRLVEDCKNIKFDSKYNYEISVNPNEVFASAKHNEDLKVFLRPVI